MNTKQMEKAFTKMLHPDISDEVFLSIEDYIIESGEGIVIFLDKDFEELYRCDPKMIHHLYWYLGNPKKNYIKAINSNNPLDRVLGLIDKQTGSRVLSDWTSEKDELIKLFYELRKKYQ